MCIVTSLAYTPLSVHSYRVVSRPCQVTAAQCTPTPHPSPSIHTGWVVASGNRTPNLTFNTLTRVKGQVGGSIPTGNNPPSMNGRRRVRGWGALGCSNLTWSGHHPV
ncbi:hypothetical protein DEO72_LG11g3935 [Vigna unguiculata]|uniref:Uncharacterized protein n=1 Tax=Vigna unguiculata TaxID=3917 RepID=A0A4D6NTB3_VIGUN|nr:hypothetical protein DEO72_LG11g3935 [Vigna unguiculata]